MLENQAIKSCEEIILCSVDKEPGKPETMWIFYVTITSSSEKTRKPQVKKTRKTKRKAKVKQHKKSEI